MSPLLQPLADYLNGQFPTIQGWCSPFLWQTIQPIHEFQESKGLRRPVAEIGVHYGKFFIGLLKTKNVPEGNFAIDVFDMQEFNLDHSGKGSLLQFEKFLAQCGVPRNSVEILQTDSLAIKEIQLLDIDRKAGGFSLFSVDGCHLAEHTYIDVKTARRLTAPEGIILVDDYYNPSWPGVQEGVAKLFFVDAPRFVPVAFSCAKLFLAHISHHSMYLELISDFIKEKHPETRIKRVKRFGYDSLTIIPDQKVGRPIV